MAHDRRAVLRLLADRDAEPAAVILDGRTLQSTPQSGARGGYAGSKRRKGCKVPVAVDTLGHLLALKITAANEQERAQVADLAREIQTVTADMVEVASVDQGDTGAQPAAQAEAQGDASGSHQTPGSQTWVCPLATALGGGAILDLGGTLPSPGP